MYATLTSKEVPALKSLVFSLNECSYNCEIIKNIILFGTCKKGKVLVSCKNKKKINVSYKNINF